MDLMLFIVFIIITLVIIFLSFYASEHSELGLVGFLFLFLLSMVILVGDIQYKTGINETYTYGCLCCSDGFVVGQPYNESEAGCTSENATLSVVSVEKTDVYTTFESGEGTLSHVVGYYLAVASIVGFIGVLLGLRYQFKRRDEDA